MEDLDFDGLFQQPEPPAAERKYPPDRVRWGEISWVREDIYEELERECRNLRRQRDDQYQRAERLREECRQRKGEE